MRILCSLLFSLAMLALARTAQAEPVDKPISLHPANGHYFLWRGKPTILVTSAEHYGAVLNLDFDFERYLQTLQADGLNLTRVFSGTYHEVPGSFGITDNTLSPKPGRFVSPWARSDTPGCADGGNKFDLSRWDDAYFGRLNRFMQAAAKAGVVVEFNFFCPLYDKHVWAVSPLNAVNNVNRIGDCPRDETQSLKHANIVEVQRALVAKCVRELNGYDNLYFEICNEPYVRKLPDDWQHDMVETITKTESELPNRHLISLNVANGRKKIVDPHPSVSIFNFHYCVPPDVVALNFGLNKVIGENETGFRGKHDFLYRSEAWDFLLAGGGLYNNLDYSFTTDHPAGDFLDYQSPGGGSPALRRQLGALKGFLEGFDFVAMTPDADVIRGVSEGLQARALSQPSKAYAIYLHVPLPEKPKRLEDHLRDDIQASLSLKLPAGPWRAEWIDCQSGAVAKTEEIRQAGGDVTLQSPKFSNDIGLRVVPLGQ